MPNSIVQFKIVCVFSAVILDRERVSLMLVNSFRDTFFGAWVLPPGEHNTKAA